MGAISDPSSLPVLKEYLNDSERSVRETCEIAIAKIEWDNSEEGKRHHASLNESSIPYVLVQLIDLQILMQSWFLACILPLIPPPPPLAYYQAQSTQKMYRKKASNIYGKS